MSCSPPSPCGTRHTWREPSTPYAPKAMLSLTASWSTCRRSVGITSTSPVTTSGTRRCRASQGHFAPCVQPLSNRKPPEVHGLIRSATRIDESCRRAQPRPPAHRSVTEYRNEGNPLDPNDVRATIVKPGELIDVREMKPLTL